MAKENLSDEQVALLQDDGVDIDALASEVVAETPPETAPEAPPEAEAAPEGATPPEQPNAAEAAPAGYVPNQALKEAREEAKNYREELRKMQGWQAEIASKLADQRAMGQQPHPDEPQIPNAETDPVESIAWTQKQVQEMQQAQQERETQWQRQYQDQQRQQQIFNAASTEFDQATAADPAIQEAYNFAAESYSKEMQALGTPPEQMQDKIQTFIMGFAHNYLSGAKPRGVSMADYVKAIAGARGWRPEAPRPNEAVETIERQQKAQTAAQTLSKTGSGSGETTLQDIASMDGAELEKFAQENPELFARLTG